MRILLFLLVLYLMVSFFSSVSILYYPVSFDLIFLLPHIISLLIVTYDFNRIRRENISVIDNSEWSVSLCKLSVVISLITMISISGVDGRSERLELISSSTILYYCAFINSSIIMVLISSLFECVKKELTNKAMVYLIVAILFSSLTNFSRSLAFFFIIAVLLSKVRFAISFKKIMFFVFPVLIVMLAMPVLQGRTTNIFEAFNRSVLNIIFYTSYSFGLGLYIINKTGFDGLSFGYIGYIASRILHEPLSSNLFFDSKYIYDFVNLGTSDIYGPLNANVMYPLWATTYYDFGNLSFLPYLFLAWLINLNNSKQWYIISSWLYFRFLILGFFVSPILLRDIIFELVVVFLLQFVLRKRMLKIGNFRL